MNEKYVDIKGIRTRYLEAGKGEPLLLVHGSHFGRYCSANDWILTIDSFAESFHVFAIDKIGGGFTDNPKSDEEYVIGTTVQHTYDFLKTMKIDSAHVVGHSRGGYTVCRLALEQPEVVKTLVIVNSATLMTSSPAIQARYDERDREAALITDTRERYHFIVAAHSFRSEHITDDFVDVMIEVEALPKSREAMAKMEAGLMLQFEKDLVTKQKETCELIRAGGIKAPTLIVWGFNDPTAKFDPVGLDGLRLILPSTPRSQMHILNEAGHWCFREQPDAFIAAVTSFIGANLRMS
jgi:pimeloyl-ACP methyl ester carboxylesterase